MFSSIDYVEIAGLSLSGAADGSGVWTTGIDLSGFVPVPSGATGVLIGALNEASSDGWAGIRTTGKTAAEFKKDQLKSSIHTVVVDLAGGTSLDFYLERSQNRFFILGFFDSDVTFFDIDGPRPVLPADASGNTANRDLPAGITTTSSAVITSEAVLSAGDPETNNTLDGILLRGAVPLPVFNGQTRYASFGDLPVVAEVKSGAFTSSYTQSVAVTDDGTWRLAPVSDATASGVWAAVRTDPAVTYGLRSAGSVSAVTTPYTDLNDWIVSAVGLNSGEFEYLITSSTTAEFSLLGWMSPSPSTTPTLRKSSAFDIETTLSGTVTSATLNGNAITVDSQAGTTVTLTDSDGSIATSGEYNLVLTDDSADPDETIVVQVNVVGLPSNTAKKDGGILVSLSDLTLDAVNASGTVVKQLTGLTTDASGIISPVDLSDISEAVGDTLKVSLHSAASDVGVTFEQALENI